MKSLDKMHKDVLARIIDLKDKHNLSDKDFGIQSGIGEKAIDNWKRGQSASFMKKIDLIAEFFNVSADYLLVGNEQKNKPDAESDELGPKGQAIWERLKKIRAIDEDAYEMAVAQLDVILNHQEKKHKP